MITHIPLDAEPVPTIRSLIPQKWHDLCWIAGSAAARWPEAQQKGGDVDVWLCTGTWPYLRYKEIIDHFRSTIVDENEDYAWMFDKLYAKDGIHIMGAYACPIQDVVNSFDISCHAAAVHIVTGQTYQHPQFDTNVRLLDWSRAPRVTLARGMKFAMRYQDQGFWGDQTTQACAAKVFRDRRLAVSDGL